MDNSLIFGAYWDARSEPIDLVANKILQTIDRLSKIDDQFLRWYKLGSSKSKSINSPVIFNIENLKAMCLQGLKKNEIDDLGYSEKGFLVMIWSGHSGSEASLLTFSTGSNSRYFINSVVLGIPAEGPARMRLLRTSKSLEVLNALIEIWNPDYAVLTSEGLRNYLNVGNRIGFLTYFKELKKAMIDVPDFTFFEGNSGIIFYEDRAELDFTNINKYQILKKYI